MAANEIYYKRKANHECTYCGIKLPDNYSLTRCDKCLELNNATARYAKRIAEKTGMCTICKKRKARPDRKTCELCGRKKADEAIARRKRLKEQGLCIMCGKVPHSETSCLCEACKIKWRGYNY